MKTLYLLRHAKSDHPHGVVDKERPINSIGRAASALIGEYMKANQLVPDIALCSSAKRTQQTLQHITRNAGFSPKTELVDRLYMATPGEMIATLNRISDDIDTVLMVAHNPGTHQLANLLARDENSPERHALRIKYPTACLSVITLDLESWKNVEPGCGTLTAFVPPKSLR